MTTTRQYDFLNRLQSIASVGTGSTPSPISFGYLYNDANQRTRRTEADGSYWVYQYDALGQVTSGRKYWADGSPVPGQQFEYGFDDIGNRTSAKFGGDANGANLRYANYTPDAYTPNLLNQYISRTVPGGFDVLGLAYQGSGVMVNSSAADYRWGEYFWEPVTVVNTTSPVWQSVIVTAGGTPSSGN